MKNYFEKSQQMTTKAWKITQHAKGYYYIQYILLMKFHHMF